ncbi:MAG: hypothetical protein U1C74_32635 [Phenylobacterium sp.]|nr:hypothetical protein [Phenylobacterium sp.]
MLKSMLAAALSGLILLAAPPASAQSPQSEAVGTELARTIFHAISFEAIITKEMNAEGNPFGDVTSRPEWSGYLADAMREEIAHDLPHLEALFGRALARDMTLAELQIGVVILSDPTMQAMMRAGAEGDTEAEPEGEPSPEMRRALSSREGASFLNKLERLDDILEPLQDEFVVAILPGAFRRFADKADAGETARKAAGR